MTEANIAGAAYDASVYTDEAVQVGTVREVKTASAVSYFERELQKAEEALEQLQRKVERAQERLDDAKVAVEEKQAEKERIAEELESAKEQL